MSPSKNEVVDAIATYSPQVLKRHLEAGYDLDMPLFGGCGVKVFKRLKNLDNVDEDLKMGLLGGDDGSDLFFPLHAAVVYLYHAVKSPYMAERALENINIMLNHHRKTAKWGCGDVLIFNAEGYEWIHFQTPRGEYGQNLPVNLAMFLKQYPWEGYEDETLRYLDRAIIMLDRALEHMGVEPRTERVLTGVTTSYKSMLFSEEFSDITFVCSDGVSIPAHKLVLAANSECLKTAFQGPWAANHKDGKWETSHSSELMKALLTIMYTGSVAESKKLAKKTEPMDFFQVVFELGVKALYDMALACCINSIYEANVKEMLQLAQLHSSRPLKTACFEYARNKAGKVLTQPNMVKLASEDPDLWQEMCDFVNEVPASKRQRKA